MIKLVAFERVMNWKGDSLERKRRFSGEGVLGNLDCC
jgi:hypothetical protein